MPIISKIINQEKTGAEVANWFLGAATANRAGVSARVAAEIKRIVGQTSDEWNAIRSAAWDKIINSPNGTPRNAQEIAKAILDFTRGNGKPLSGVLFSEAELSQMQKLARVIEMTKADQRAFNPSRSGYEVVRSLVGSYGLPTVAGFGGWSITGDSQYLALAALPLLRNLSRGARANAATNANPAGIFSNALGGTMRLPQAVAPALISGGGR